MPFYTRFYLLALSAFFLVFSPAAYAQEADGLKLPPPGTVILNLSATETKKVPQDLLVASLRIEAESDKLEDVQGKINIAMQAALALAKSQPDIKVTTGAYSVYPYDSRPPIEQQNGGVPKNRWRGQQTIDLQSLKSEPVLELTGKLQEKGFAMNNLGYTLSPAKYESVQDDLMVAALKKIQAKAALAAKSMDKKNYDMLDVNLSPSGPVYPMYARAEMAMDMSAKSMPAPVAAAGETDVSLSVSARVLLKP
jgi:predicted secreted protein